jgi:hypothetical protein
MIDYEFNKKDSERVIRLKAEASGGFGHITAEVVRNAISDRTNPDTGKVEYNDGEGAIGFRRCSWSANKMSALYIEDLVIKSQFDTDGDKPAYAFMTKFASPYQVELCDAANMFHTLKTIDAKLEKIRKDFGSPETFADHLVRIAKILGIKKFIIGRTNNEPLSSNNYINFGATSVAYEIKKLEDSVRTISKSE